MSHLTFALRASSGRVKRRLKQTKQTTSSKSEDERKQKQKKNNNKKEKKKASKLIYLFGERKKASFVCERNRKGESFFQINRKKRNILSSVDY